MAVIYKITNRLNGKLYIGQTRQTIEKRFIQHSKADSPLGNAMRDCGLDNFTIEVIEECATQDQANDRERFWIKVLNCKVPDGYNRSNGGEGNKYIPSVTVKRQFIDRLKSLRNSRKISQKDFAQALKVSQQTVAGWESGRTEPSNTALKDIADYFNVTTDYLLGRETIKAPALSDEQTTVLKGFDSLNSAGRNLLVAVLNSLRVSHAAAL